MSTISFSVRAAKLDSHTLTRVADFVRTFALKDARERRANYAGKEDEWSTSSVEDADKEIADGGWVYTVVTSVTERDGVNRVSEQDGDLTVDHLLDYQSVDVTLSTRRYISSPIAVHLTANDWNCSVRISAPSEQVDSVAQGVKSVLSDAIDLGRLESQVRPFKVFLGHGSDPQWKYLQRALNDTHGFLVEAFESAERAGFHTLVVVDQMVRSSTVAVVVMTGEDTMLDGSVRTRENVVHEIGFCQGVLGMERTLILLEEGVSEPSNISGLTQIRFPKGRLIDVEDKIVEALNQRKQAQEYSRA